MRQFTSTAQTHAVPDEIEQSSTDRRRPSEYVIYFLSMILRNEFAF